MTKETPNKMTPKEARLYTIIGSIVAVIIVIAVALVGFTIWNAKQQTSNQAVSAKTAFQNQKTKPKYASKDGAIVINHDGVVKDPDASTPLTPVVDIYIDFNCPGCASTDQALSSSYVQLLGEGKITLRVHPIAFLDTMSSDRYSTRAAEAAWKLSDVAPDKFLSFVTYSFSSTVFPGEGTSYKTTNNAKIVQNAINAGVDKSVAKTITDGTYSDYVSKLTDWTVTRTELYRSGSNKFSTPIVLLNNKSINFDVADLAAEFNQEVEKAYNGQ
jgi:protein-disulfide isomerase